MWYRLTPYYLLLAEEHLEHGSITLAVSIAVVELLAILNFKIVKFCGCVLRPESEVSIRCKCRVSGERDVA